jgi:hypothetical protein
MIYQRFGQGVSNLSTVAELKTFDGIVRHTGIQEFPNLNPCSKGGSYNVDETTREPSIHKTKECPRNNLGEW